MVWPDRSSISSVALEFRVCRSPPSVTQHSSQHHLCPNQPQPFFGSFLHIFNMSSVIPIPEAFSSFKQSAPGCYYFAFPTESPCLFAMSASNPPIIVGKHYSNYPRQRHIEMCSVLLKYTKQLIYIKFYM